MDRTLRLAPLLILTLLVGRLDAQVEIASPISFLGVGERMDLNTLYVQSMGSSGATFHELDRLNMVNPASLAYLKTTTFSGGLMAERRVVSDGDLEATNWSGAPLHFSIGMPTQNQFNTIINRREPKVKWGLGFDLRLQSRRGFDFEGSQSFGLVPTDTLRQGVVGDGSLVQVGLSSGWKYKNASIGISAGYRFGSSETTTTQRLLTSGPGGFATYSIVDDIDEAHRSFVWNIGAMYDIVLDYKVRADGTRAAPNKYLTLGLTWHGDQSIRQVQDRLKIRRNTRFQTGDQVNVLVDSEDVIRDATWPSMLRAGISYVNDKKLRLNAEYTFEPWSNFDDGRAGETSNLQNAFSLSSGLAFTPDDNSISSYFEKVTYTLGAYYEQDERVLQGEQIEDLGLRLGLSLPFYGQRQVSHLHLHFSMGTIGIGDAYEERYMRVGLEYAFTDNQWFIKRKYD